MGVEVEVRDTGMAKLERQLRALDTAVTFGVHGDAAPYPDGTDVVSVASIHEFGVPSPENPGNGVVDIPQRSFLRSYVDSRGKREIAEAAQKSVGKIIDGSPVSTFADDVGEVAVDGVVKLIRSGISPALADGSGRRPLDRTGHLIDSITAKPVED